MKLNLGCGTNPLPTADGWVNVDRVAVLPEGEMVQWDLDQIPWPFNDDQFEEVRAVALVEHLRDKMAFLEELWRVCAHGARVYLLTINILHNPSYWHDPTHRVPWHPGNLEFLAPGHGFSYYTPARFVTLQVGHTIQVLSWLLAAYKRDDPELLSRQVDWRASNWNAETLP